MMDSSERGDRDMVVPSVDGPAPSSSAHLRVTAALLAVVGLVFALGAATTWLRLEDARRDIRDLEAEVTALDSEVRNDLRAVERVVSALDDGRSRGTSGVDGDLDTLLWAVDDLQWEVQTFRICVNDFMEIIADAITFGDYFEFLYC